MPADGPPRFSRSDLDAEVAKRLKAIRQSKRMTRRELASEAGIARKTLARHEQGRQRPSEPALRRLATTLGVQISDLAPGWKDDDLNRLTTGTEHPGIGLRLLRKERGVSLEAAAQAAGVTAGTLSRFERGMHASRKLARRVDGPIDDRLVLTSDALARLLGFEDAESLTFACEEKSSEV
ncbi:MULTISPECIES: helix-turn-helix transcriptional regulator [unclassified Erythrobacter]|uniref:helix-turn-helix domain-containing protein n=1 Tax=unclassified Erythrobacter TaxID=2633097 RepID=UPI0009ED0FA5